MAIGDSDNIVSRLKSLIPSGWFGPVAPIRDALLGGLADSLAWQYAQSMIVAAQTRLATASGWFLDLAAYDFFGLRIKRPAGLLDAPFRARIRKEILRERVTRKGMIQALLDLTGKPPVIFEPWSPQDGAAIGVTFAAGVGFPVGSLQYPSQVFITAFRPGNAGVANVAGIGTVAGGVGVGALTPISLADETGITDADIFQTMADTKPTGSIVWGQLV